MDTPLGIIISVMVGGILSIVVRAFYEGARDAYRRHKDEVALPEAKYFWVVIRDSETGRMLRTAGSSYDTRTEAWAVMMNNIFLGGCGPEEKFDLWHGSRSDLIGEIAKGKGL